MSGLFLTVLKMSAAAGLTALVVMLLRFPLKRVPKIFSYALWAVVLFRLVCPISFESPLGFIPTGRIDTGIMSMTAGSPEPAFSQLPATQNAESSTYLGNAASSDIDPAAAPLPRQMPHGNPAVNILSAVWLGGAVLLAGYGLLSYIALKRKLRYATLKNSNIYESDRIKTPFLLGYFRPKIYIPVSVSGPELDYVLKHEETHIKRYDHIIKTVSYLALCLHWFNPVIWLSFCLMSKDMEMSCDESVLKRSESDIRVNYSNTLLSLSVRQGLVSPLAFGEGDAKKRIRNIMNYKKPAFWAVLAVPVAILCAVFVLTANPREKAALGAPVEASADISADASAADASVADASPPVSPDAPPVTSHDAASDFYESEALGISLSFPADWRGRYYIDEGPDTLSVYCKAVHDDASQMGGWLFDIVRLTGELITKDDLGQTPEPTKYLLNGNGYTYYASFASDVQYPMDNESLSSEYRYLDDHNADVYGSIALYGDKRPEAINEDFKVVGTSFFTVEIPEDWEMTVKEDALLTWSIYDGNTLIGIIARTAALESSPYLEGLIRETSIQDHENRRYAEILFCAGDENTMNKISESFSFTGGYYTVADLKSAAELYVYYGGQKLFGRIDSIEIDYQNSAVIHATIMDFDYSGNAFPQTVNTYEKTFEIDSIQIAPLTGPDRKLLGTYAMYPIGKYTREDERFFSEYPDYTDYYYDFVTDSAGMLKVVIGHYVP